MNTKTSAAQIAAFYDGFERRLIRDYLRGNRRTEAAIRHALRSTPTSAKRVLDIGCGIGWSSHEIAQAMPRADVTAVDISARLIDVARRLWGEGRARFEVRDVLQSGGASGGAFDAIVMLDVYEHISAEQRRAFHAALGELLQPEGVLVLTCPTPEHQAFLRAHKPEGLQPVDEDVDEQTIAALARDVGGVATMFDRVRIWNDNDYSHIVVRRGTGVVFEATRDLAAITLEAPESRRQRAAEALGVQLLATGELAALNE